MCVCGGVWGGGGEEEKKFALAFTESRMSPPVSAAAGSAAWDEAVASVHVVFRLARREIIVLSSAS